MKSIFVLLDLHSEHPCNTQTNVVGFVPQEALYDNAEGGVNGKKGVCRGLSGGNRGAGERPWGLRCPHSEGRDIGGAGQTSPGRLFASVCHIATLHEKCSFLQSSALRQASGGSVGVTFPS